MPGTLLVAGTTSDAGKSVVTAGLCRLLARRGQRVAPFKAQNMSNNSMVVRAPDGTCGEIGRAQWVQAVAAGVEPETVMNPVLLKPGSDRRSHVVINGQPAGEITSMEFAGGRRWLADAAFAAFDDLRARFDIVICEGAGSPTEINLRASDYVNMGLARRVSMPVVVVGDIDRGGVYAALFGTIALLEPEDQRLISGFVINKFRGEEALLEPANLEIAKLTGRPVLGVLPWSPSTWLDSEDGLDVSARAAETSDPLQVVVVRLPRISNFTDIDALGLEPDVDVRFAARAGDFADADLILIPGSRATLSDLAWMRARGLDQVVIAHAAAGRPVLGICGGFQMLGRTIADPLGVEGDNGASVEGLGLLDATTTFSPDKVLALPSGMGLGVFASGYEIHHGVVDADGDEFPGGTRHGNVFGTMWHGSLESDEFRAAFLDQVCTSTGRNRPQSGVSFPAAREARLDHLADLLEKHVDVEAIMELISSGATVGLPVLPPGASGTAPR